MLTLFLIKWKDSHGQIQKYYPINKISHKWRDIGVLVGLSLAELNNISAKHSEDAKRCCEAVLEKWLDSPPHHYPTTWQGLLEVLEDSQLSRVVSELKNILDKNSLSQSLC